MNVIKANYTYKKNLTDRKCELKFHTMPLTRNENCHKSF